MRVAIVSEHASPLAVLGGADAGGQNVHVAALAAGLVERGARVVVHTRRDDPDAPSQVRLGRVVVDHVTAGPAKPLSKDLLFPYMDEFAEHLHRQWSARRPDVVHSHFWMSGYAAVRAARPLGIPVLHTFHALGVVKRREQGGDDTSPAERIGTETDLLHDADRILATCPGEVFELLRMGADRHRLEVIPCGVDVRHYTPDGPSAPRPPGARLLYVGRLVPRKGIGNAITALAEVPGADLVVAGGPDAAALERDPEVGRLRSLAAALGVADRVRFIGRVERAELPALYRSADAVLCVPWYEPFGIAAVEAMACGVPVVATAVGGLADTVVDGVTGIHVPPRRPDKVADALRLLLADPGLRRRLGEAGRSRATAHYAMDRVVAATERSYARTARASRAVRGMRA